MLNREFAIIFSRKSASTFKSHIWSSSFKYAHVAGAREAQEYGAPEEVFQQADRDTPRSVGGRIDDWFNRILSRLPQQQIATLREQVEKYLTQEKSSGDEIEELTDDDQNAMIENAKCLIEGVMKKFSTDADQSAVHSCKFIVYDSCPRQPDYENRPTDRFFEKNLTGC